MKRLDPRAVVAAATTFALWTERDARGRWHDFAALPGVCDRCGDAPAVGALASCGGWTLCPVCCEHVMQMAGWTCPTCPPDVATRERSVA